jgi:hypothetical protein
MTTIQTVVYSDNKFTGKRNYSLVVSTAPNFIYEQKGFWLLAEDDGFYSSYSIEFGSRGAFGGRKFDIPLKDGTVYKATGQVWDAFSRTLQPEPSLEVGVATLDQLKDCYVFFGGRVAVSKLEQALEQRPLMEYWDFDKYVRELKRGDYVALSTLR